MYDHFILLVILAPSTMVDEAVGIVAALMAMMIYPDFAVSGNGTSWMAFGLLAFSISALKRATISDRERN